VYLAWSTKDPPQERERIAELLMGLYGNG